jgi:hypothetical protein
MIGQLPTHNLESIGRRMQAVVPQLPVVSTGDKVLSGFLNLLIVIAGIFVLYYAYKFLVSPAIGPNELMVQPEKKPMNALMKYPKVAALYEGGEYTVNLWVYIAGYTTHYGTRKHILEIGGDNFATLLIALGAFKSSLLVRVHTKASSGGETLEAFRVIDKFQDSATDLSESEVPVVNPTPTISTDYNDPALLSKEDISLSNEDKDVLFSPLAMDDGLLNVFPMCDIQQVDMQRWIQITVVLNGRTCDTYINGKLARSCVLRSYYKVDTTDISMRVADRSGFDGYTSRISTYSTALNPDQIYKLYMAGPDGENMNPIQYVKNIL